MRVEDVLTRLDGVTGGSGQWSARCPAHDDRQASLTVGVGRDDRVLVKCWAGCELEQITAALDMKLADLFPDKHNGRTPDPLGQALAQALRPTLPTADELERQAAELQRAPSMLEAIFELKGWRADVLAALGIGLRANRLAIPVRALDGRLINVLRYWPQAQPKMLATRGHPRAPLYVMVDDTGPVWITEGETDAISLAMLGLNVIGAPGATAKAHAEWCDPVRDRDTIVIMDADEPGRRAAVRWSATAANRGAASVRVVELEGPKGYDVGDLVREHRHEPGEARRRLYELADAAPLHDEPRQIKAPDVVRPSEAVDEAIEAGTIIGTRLNQFRLERLQMLWRERVPIGRVGIIYGPPGQGKSTLLALIAADVTQAGGLVLIASAEDDPSTTLLPRMIAAGADVGLFDVISTKARKGATGLVLPRDLDALGERMRGAAMLMIDPLSAHLGDDVNSWREQDVRAKVLAPLSHHAAHSGCACPLVMHLTKSNDTDPLGRISGSGGFAGAARFALLLGSHPDDLGLEPNERRLALVHVKASETARQPAIVFRRRVTAVQAGEQITVVPVLDMLDDQAQIAPESVLEHTDPDEAGAFTEAIEYLRRELADGAKPSKRLLAQARERGDFSERTLRKAKRALKIASTKETDGWWWALA